MKNQKTLLIGGAIGLIVVSLVVGAFLGPRIPFTAKLTGGGRPGFGANGSDAGGPGGSMGGMSEEQRKEFENMTDEERQEFMKEQGGPDGGPQGGGGAQMIEGEIVETATDSITLKTSNGGSRTVYFDDDTTIGFSAGAQKDSLAQGDSIIAVAQAGNSDVTTAQVIVVK